MRCCVARARVRCTPVRVARLSLFCVTSTLCILYTCIVFTRVRWWLLLAFNLCRAC